MQFEKLDPELIRDATLPNETKLLSKASQEKDKIKSAKLLTPIYHYLIKEFIDYLNSGSVKVSDYVDRFKTPIIRFSAKEVIKNQPSVFAMGIVRAVLQEDFKE